MAEKNRNTVQKEVVEKVVLSACDHPTAETVYLRAKEELPSISLGTVYRILKQLTDAGKVLEIPIKDAPSVYDKTTFDHAHLVCEKCGKITDVGIDSTSLVDSVNASGGKVENIHVLFFGLCPECANQNSTEIG